MDDQSDFPGKDVVDLRQPLFRRWFRLPLDDRGTGTRLLPDMGQLVREEAASRRRVWTELAVCERDVATDGEGAGVQRGRRHVPGDVSMHANPAEVKADSRLHKSSGAEIELLPRVKERAGARQGAEHRLVVCAQNAVGRRACAVASDRLGRRLCFALACRIRPSAAQGSRRFRPLGCKDADAAHVVRESRLAVRRSAGRRVPS
ncbi:MAG: hypothetical protein L0H79_01435 [Intrasporangium sp.]|nr:hypothetical protein [Intrasporangium sp.]MDN5794398.1 hypothetical protein [Intrasporangium sp.]